MGFKETLKTEWKNQILEYKGKKLFIVEQFEYEGKEYLYTIDIDTVENDVIDLAFLYKIKDDIFGNVNDDNLFNELIAKVAGILSAEKIKEIFNI